MMLYLIVRVMNRDISDSEPVAEWSRPYRHPAHTLKVSTINTALSNLELECGKVGGSYAGYPFVAIAYLSPDPDGIGRAGSQIFRLPARQRNDSHIRIVKGMK